MLHDTAAFEQTGKRIASLFVHYADGEMREIPIVAGQDVGGWQTWSDTRRDGRADPVWSGLADGSRTRLYPDR